MYKPSSFSQNCQKFGNDDGISEQRRKAIREHLESQIESEDDRIRNSGRLSEYELNKLIKSFSLPSEETTKNPEIDEEALRTAGFQNLRPLYDDNNTYRAALDNLTPKKCEAAKKAGIRYIVSVKDNKDNIKCKGLEYVHFPVSSVFSGIFLERECSQEAKKFFNQKFVKFIQTMQKENVLIGCEWGTKSTDYALCLNSFFNPKTEITMPPYDNSFGLLIKRIYDNLSQQDKKDMGWDEKFDKSFMDKLERYYPSSY